jgi:hypothetical protein
VPQPAVRTVRLSQISCCHSAQPPSEDLTGETRPGWPDPAALKPEFLGVVAADARPQPSQRACRSRRIASVVCPKTSLTPLHGSSAAERAREPSTSSGTHTPSGLAIFRGGTSRSHRTPSPTYPSVRGGHRIHHCFSRARRTATSRERSFRATVRARTVRARLRPRPLSHKPLRYTRSESLRSTH